MIGDKEYYILAFHTTTDVMEAEKKLKDNFAIAIMPVPREISSGCGLCIRFQNPDEEKIVNYLSSITLGGTLYKMSTKKIDGARPIHKIIY